MVKISKVLKTSDPYTDYMVAKEKFKYDDFEGSEGCIHLFQVDNKKCVGTFFV